MTGEKDALWTLLLEVKEEFRAYEQRVDAHLVQSSSDRQRLDVHMASEEVDRQHLRHLCSQVQLLNKLITHGNGQDSVLTKLARLETEMSEVRTDTHENKVNIKALVQALLDDDDDPDVSEHAAAKEKWVAVGKVAGFIALISPGIMAFLGWGT